MAVTEEMITFARYLSQETGTKLPGDNKFGNIKTYISKNLGKLKADKKTILRQRKGKLIESCMLYVWGLQLKIKYNLFSNAINLDGSALDDASLTEIQRDIEDLTGLKWKKQVVYNALTSVAKQYAYHPVRDWLNSLRWDGKKRIDSFLSNGFCLKNNETFRNISHVFFNQLVRRVSDPGCKADYTLLLQGGQGIGKSGFCRLLMPFESWFSDQLPPSLDDKDLLPVLQDKWLIELPELSSLKRSELESIESFLTRQVDYYRNPYCTVFIATTNEQTPLQDPTENRGFIPLSVNIVNLNYLTENRDQLFAEAYEMYRMLKLSVPLRPVAK